MRDRIRPFPLLSLAFAAAAYAGEPTLEQVIAKHVLARGGVERWQAIESLAIRGSMTQLGLAGSFTLWLGRNDRYLLESRQHGQTIAVGYDGATAWRGNRGDPGAAQRLGGVERAMIVRDADFPTPFFDSEERGYPLKLLGPRDLDGKPAIAIAVERPDGHAETWYLDPVTFLDIGRDSPGSNFGEWVPLRTFHDDFRSVAGVQMPFRVESQWHVQERVMNVESIEVNVALEEARFSPPRPVGMDPLLPLVGEWQVVASMTAHPGAPWRDSERTSTIEKRLGGALLEERYKTASGQEVVRSYTYDRFRKEYRITEISDGSNYLDVQEGGFDDEGRLVVSNVETGTWVEGAGRAVHVRLTLADITETGFRVEKEISTDGGKSWSLAAKSTYRRAAGPS